MKVLHLIAGELTGGAARGAYWLHQGLLECNVDSRILTTSKNTFNDCFVESIQDSKLSRISKIARAFLDQTFTIFYPSKNQRFFSPGLFGFNFLKTSAYKSCDIVHLHWINNGFIDIKDLSKIDKPIVWTMRDMWPMTGGCHYSFGCMKYMTGCGSCPQLGSKNSFDLSKYISRRKVKFIPPSITLVGISNWLSEQARNSLIFQNYDVKTIHNNVSSSDFFCITKQVARQALGISTDKKVILVGSTNVNDAYKGFSKFLEALAFLDSKKYFLCFFGKNSTDSIKNMSFECVSLGYLNDNISLRLAYSAADIFVAPSIEEAFGKTLVEAMACGTPVVCFDATGPKDIVTHKVDGYKASPYDSQDLARGIDWIDTHHYYNDLCINARNKFLEKFDNKIIAEQYKKLYFDILER